MSKGSRRPSIFAPSALKIMRNLVIHSDDYSKVSLPETDHGELRITRMCIDSIDRRLFFALSDSSIFCQSQTIPQVYLPPRNGEALMRKTIFWSQQAFKHMSFCTRSFSAICHDSFVSDKVYDDVLNSYRHGGYH